MGVRTIESIKHLHILISALTVWKAKKSNNGMYVWHCVVRVCLSVINLMPASLTLTVWRGIIGLQLIWTGRGRKRPYLNLRYCHGMCLEKGTKNISQGIRYPGWNLAAALEALPFQSTCTVTEGQFDMFELDLHPVLTWYLYHVWLSQVPWMNCYC